MPDSIQQLGTQLAFALAPKRRELVTVSYGTVKAVNETDTDVRLDVDLHGGTLYGLPMTTACKGVAVGDRVVVQTYGHLSTVTGVIAHDNSHYVGEWHDLYRAPPGWVRYRIEYPNVAMQWNVAQETSAYWAAGNLPEDYRPVSGYNIYAPAASTIADGYVNNVCAYVYVSGESGEVGFQIGGSAPSGSRSCGIVRWPMRTLPLPTRRPERR